LPFFSAKFKLLDEPLYLLCPKS